MLNSLNEKLNLIQTLPGLYLIRDLINEKIETIEKALDSHESKEKQEEKPLTKQERKKLYQQRWYSRLSPERKAEYNQRNRKRYATSKKALKPETIKLPAYAIKAGMTPEVYQRKLARDRKAKAKKKQNA